jgi:hypothetical protein
MEVFLNHFFFYSALPPLFQHLGESFGFDTACACEFPNLYNLILYFIIAGYLLTILSRANVRNRGLLFTLFFGVVLSGISKFIDWSQNMLTATSDAIFWSNTLDVMVEIFQLVGLILIVYSLFAILRKVYGQRTDPTRAAH